MEILIDTKIEIFYLAQMLREFFICRKIIWLVENFCEVITMSELRNEAINLEEYLLAIVQYARRFEDKGFADEQAMFAEWERDPDTYEDKIAEYVNSWVKADRE